MSLWHAWRGWAAALGVVLGLGLLSGCAEAPEPTTVVVVPSAMATLAPDHNPMTHTPVVLPHAWDKAFPGQGGQATYEMALPERPAGVDWALYFPRVGNQVEIQLGTQVLVPLESPRDPSRDRAKSPLLVPIAAGNTARDLTVRVWTQPGRWGGLATVVYGPLGELEERYSDRYISRQYGALAVTVGMLLAALVAAGLWGVQREPVYGVFAWAALCGALRFVDRLVETPPLPWPLWGAVNALALAWFVLGMCHFCLQMVGPDTRWTRVALLAMMALEAGLVAFSFHAHLPQVWTWALRLLALPAFWTLGTVAWRAWKERSRELIVMCSAIGLAVAAGLRDLLVVRENPTGMDQFSILPHASLLFVLLLGWLVIDRYARNARAHQELLVTLDAKVRERELALQQSNALLREEHARQATLLERQRIMRDIHDGVGAQLVGLLSLLNKEGASRETLQEQAEAALDELRMAVDALQPVHGDLVTVLATLRYRLQPRLQAAGIDVVWQVNALPPVEGLTPSVVLQLQRILLEAFTNAIRHAQASCLTVSAHAAPLPLPGQLVLQVCDNGLGFDPASERDGGQGIPNMKARANAIGATLEVDSTPHQGTCVRVTLPLVP
jgi:signal transduction histidine kinase